jgi:hypothetical protein
MKASLADRASAFLASRLDRRGFLARGAIVGSALTVAPKRYLLRPGSAYAAVCGCAGSNCDCGALCCDGYTEFCCTLTGRNACPSGSVVAGWWKVDGSEFCGGGARYYMDCNAGCGSCGCGGSGLCAGACSGTPCVCGRNDCNNRRAGCNGFRYGQCNQDVACVGPIVCRVVTCTPPWQIDGTCTTTPLTDNNTRNHTAPCVEGLPIGNFESVTWQPDTGLRVAGWAADPDTNDPVAIHVYVNGVNTVIGPAARSRPDVAAAYPGFGPNHGFDAVVPAPNGTTATVCVYAINTPAGVNPLLGCRTISVPTDPFGNIDLAVMAPGRGIRVSGWMIDPDTRKAIDAQITIGGQTFPIGPANLSRPDVGHVYPWAGNLHGFDTTIPWSTLGTFTVCAYGVNVKRGSGANPIACRSVTVTASPIGALDAVDWVPGTGIRARGWALDPDAPGPITVRVTVGSTAGPTATADGERDDVAAVYETDAHHGFDVVIPWTTAGTISVCATALNVGGGTDSLLGCRPVTVVTEPFGAVPNKGVRVSGWVIDPDTTSPVEVWIGIATTVVSIGLARNRRDDVAGVYPWAGPNHGFDAIVPWTQPGTFNVCAYGVNIGNGTHNPQLGCRTVTII